MKAQFGGEFMREDDPVADATIEHRLITELQRARQAYQHSRREFERIQAESLEIGLHSPDAVQMLERATAECNRTLESYSAAVSRFSDFVLKGKAPRD